MKNWKFSCRLLPQRLSSLEGSHFMSQERRNYWARFWEISWRLQKVKKNRILWKIKYAWPTRIELTCKLIIIMGWSSGRKRHFPRLKEIISSDNIRIISQFSILSILKKPAHLPIYSNKSSNQENWSYSEAVYKIYFLRKEKKLTHIPQSGLVKF